MKHMVFAAALLAATLGAHAQQIQWRSVDQQGDYRVEWASNLVVRDQHTVSTMMRLVYSREDAAPNNARFDNERVGLSIRCTDGTYLVLGRSYNLGEREVHSVSMARAGSYEPVAGTFVQRFMDDVCRR